MDNAPFRDAFWYASLGMDAVLLARLVQLGLAPHYRMLVAYLGFEILQGGAMVYVRASGMRLLGSHGYSLIYVATQPLVWLLYFLLILEFYSQMLEEFPGIRRLGRLTLFSALTSVTLCCSSLILLDQRAGYDQYPFLSYLALQQRSVFFCLSALSLLLLLFVAHYRLAVRRNVWVLYGCFGGYFLSAAVLYTFRRHLGSQFAPLRDLGGPAFYVLALSAAALSLSPAGESESRPIGALWGSQDTNLEAALSLQLQDLNHTLLKVLRS